MSLTSPRIKAEALNTYCFLRPKHPKVVEALQRLKYFSPSRVVSDVFQPKTGDLHDRFLSEQNLTVSCQTCPIVKKEISLTLGSSILLARRNRK